MRAPSFSLLSSTLLLVGGAVAGCNRKQAECLDASLVAHSGQPVGTELKHGNRESGQTFFTLLSANHSPSHALHHQAGQEERPHKGERGRRGPLLDRRLRPCSPRKQAVRLSPPPEPRSPNPFPFFPVQKPH